MKGDKLGTVSRTPAGRPRQPGSRGAAESPRIKGIRRERGSRRTAPACLRPRASLTWVGGLGHGWGLRDWAPASGSAASGAAPESPVLAAGICDAKSLPRWVGTNQSPYIEPETKALWKLSRRAGGRARLPDPRREKWRAAPTARRLRGGWAPVPAAGVRERLSRPARRSPPRALERGGGWRRHNRTFMAWVTCFPLPQWGPVTLNRKLMREERNLIFPLRA
ncbi:PREDICTED: uncharacterized protein LOC109393010 [Hipposideros armiger]|uniref:Uncharacterized protein LOC109393010 n=1 Tax=Hipposideros armiger TaxID=186990 RepID=A0A8B7SYU9_HIPAR|nr:PREDICTED: uncharacterized protein LOC109393010 [Hipposideros armiger]